MVNGASPAASADLLADLKQHEGLRLKAYQDTVGVWTIGYGHAGLDVWPGKVWTKAQAEAALVKDAAKAAELLDRYAGWWRKLDPVRRDVLQNMCFNMGWGDGKSGLSSFKNTIRLIRLGHYEDAAENMLASKWAKQVKGRAVYLSELMRTGKRP